MNWLYFEQWAIAKYNKFGGEDWLDLVMYCVDRRAESERS
jgi:hypothetical protein